MLDVPGRRSGGKGFLGDGGSKRAIQALAAVLALYIRWARGELGISLFPEFLFQSGFLSAREGSLIGAR